MSIEATRARYYLERVFKSVVYFYNPKYLSAVGGSLKECVCDERFPADSVAHYYAMAIYALDHMVKDKDVVKYANDAFYKYPPQNDAKILLTKKMTELFGRLVGLKMLKDYKQAGAISSKTSRQTIARAQVDAVEDSVNYMEYEARERYFDEYYRVYDAIQETTKQENGEARYADYVLQTIRPGDLVNALRNHTSVEVISQITIPDPLYGNGQDKLSRRLGADGNQVVELFKEESKKKEIQPQTRWLGLHLDRNI